MEAGMRGALVAACLVWLLGAGGAEAARAGKVYCYAEGPDGTTFVTPVFVSADPPELLAALYSQSLTDAGLATCVTERDERNIAKAWQGFVDNLKAQHYPVVIQAFPSG
jgi:hypothetical protein